MVEILLQPFSHDKIDIEYEVIEINFCHVTFVLVEKLGKI